MQYPNIAQPQYGFGPTMPPGMYDTPPAMMNFKEGGMISNAQKVQSQGRNDDTMLVHMTPREVGGLQALAMAHGGSLTINPKTGLPEAGFLKNLLPTLLGVGLSFIPGVGPLAAGMITGGIETVRTGDIGKGFLAGLGAYGGANLAGGLQSAGTAAASAAAPSAATTAANVGANVGEASLSALTPTQQLTTGFKSVFDTGATGQAARDAFMGKVGGYGGLATQAGMAAAPSLLTQPEYKPPQPKDEGSNYEGPYTPSARRVSYPGEEERRRSSEFTYFTPSNPVPFDAGGKVEEDRSIKMPDASYVAGTSPEFSHGFKAVEVVQPSLQNAPATIGGKGAITRLIRSLGSKKDSNYTDLSGYEYDPQTQTMRRMAEGGIAALARGGSVPMLEDGGFVLTKKAVDGLGKGNNKKGQQVASAGLGAIPIRGKGTGTSDSIKTSIDGKRPALVSNGEAYVPKKQVAKRGGAKAFYALMNKAEKAADRRKRA
jgi:hypothetical protein